jgi:hypothetical protein
VDGESWDRQGSLVADFDALVRCSQKSVFRSVVASFYCVRAARSAMQIGQLGKRGSDIGPAGAGRSRRRAKDDSLSLSSMVKARGVIQSKKPLPAPAEEGQTSGKFKSSSVVAEKGKTCSLQKLYRSSRFILSRFLVREGLQTGGSSS